MLNYLNRRTGYERDHCGVNSVGRAFLLIRTGKGSTVINAVIFVPEAEHLVYIAQCTEYCQNQGYQIAGVIRDDWRATVAMLSTGLATIIIMARPDHFDPAWEPRVEFVSDAAAPQPAGGGRPASQRRRRPRRVS